MGKIKSTELSRDGMILWVDENLDSIVGWVLSLPKPSELGAGSIDEAYEFLEKGYRKEKDRILKFYPQGLSGEDKNKVNFIDSLFKNDRFIKKLGEPPNFDFRIEESLWQYPIMNRRSIVGFADLRAVISIDDFLLISFGGGGSFDAMNLNVWMSPTNEKGWSESPSWDTVSKTVKFFFVVEPGCPSLMKVIQKIRKYQKYESIGNRFFVVSSDARTGSILKQQGIGFIPYGKDFKKEKINAEKIREET